MKRWTQKWPVSNGQRWALETIDATWSQKFTLVYTLNPELMCRSIVTDTDLLKTQFTLDLHYINNFDIFMLIIDYQVIIKFDDWMFEARPKWPMKSLSAI